jgi:hypothetical protein
MNTQQIMAKLKAYPLALGLLLVAIALAGWAYYRSGTLDDLYGDLDTVTAENDQTSKNVTDSINLKEQLDQLNAGLVQFTPGLINTTAIIPNQQYFYDLEQSTGVKIYDPGQGLTIHSKDPAEPSITNFKLTAAGSWDNFITFLNALQTGPHFIRFDQIVITKSEQTRSVDSNGQAVSATISLEVLGQ